jgi:hypothetical protein
MVMVAVTGDDVIPLEILNEAIKSLGFKLVWNVPNLLVRPCPIKALGIGPVRNITACPLTLGSVTPLRLTSAHLTWARSHRTRLHVCQDTSFIDNDMSLAVI